MQNYQSRTPFGARVVELAHVAAQATAEQVQGPCPAQKWVVFRDICAARRTLALSERSLSVLNALLTFHPESVLTAGPIIVWPSNANLSLRAHGMPEATIRRHIACLVDAGVIIRRDSPNGKRYARKDYGGEVEKAFGFDLAPLVARAAEFARRAETVRAEEKAYRLARERVTVARRDIVKLLQTLTNEGHEAEAEVFQDRYRSIATSMPRSPALPALVGLAAAFEEVSDEVYNTLQSLIKTENMNGNPDQTERHIQNSNPDRFIESEPVSRKETGAKVEPDDQPRVKRIENYPLGFVLQACPTVADYTKAGVQDWRDFENAAAVVRPMLGISPSAWAEAQDVLGLRYACVVLAAMLERAEAIKSPGGYLRALVGKARDGEFSLGPMLMALINTKGRVKAAAG